MTAQEPARRRARRGDGLRVARRRRLRARRVVVAHPGDHARPRAGGAGAGRARQDAVLARRPARPPDRVRRGDRGALAQPGGVAGRGRDRASAGASTGSIAAAANLVAYLREQAQATGEVPSDRTSSSSAIVDEIGDWRVCVLSPFGARVHAPWATAVTARLRGATAGEVEAIWSDDGIVFRLPESDEPPEVALLLPAADEIEDRVIRALGQTSLFAARFRENAARALLLPRRHPGRRSPLWAQRKRAADLLAVASRYGSFPILLETYRECLRDVFDLPGLVDILRRIESRRIRVRHGRLAHALALRGVAAVLLRGELHLRRRRAAGRAAGAGALGRPGAAARAAGRGRAARAARCRRDRGPRAVPAAARGLQDPAARRPARSPARAGRSDRGGDSRALGGSGGGAAVDRGAAARPAGGARDDRRRGSNRGRGGRGTVSGRPGCAASARTSGRVPRAGPRRARRSPLAVRADPRPVPRRGRRRAVRDPRGNGPARAGSPGGARPGDPGRLSPGRPLRANGASPACCGRSSGARSPSSAARSSPSSPSRSRVS